jgi:hypothetical protein
MTLPKLIIRHARERVLDGQLVPVDHLDFSEHVPDGPQRYRHGWIPINPLDVPTTAQRSKAKAAYAKAQMLAFDRLHGAKDGEFRHFNYNATDDSRLIGITKPPAKFNVSEITKYSDSDLNGALRRGHVPDDRQLQQIDQSFSKTTINGLLYRDMPADALGPDLAGLVGKTVKDRGYLSTTWNPGQHMADPGLIRVKIKVPKGTPAIFVEPHSIHAEEGEVLLPRNTKLKVEKVETVDGVPLVTVRVVGIRTRTKAEVAAEAEAKAWNRAHPPKASNVVASYNDATPEEIADGMSWYEDAQFTAEAFAAKTGVSVHTAAGIIATYSPQTAWAANMLRAAKVLRTKKGIGGPGAEFMATGSQRERANRILGGESWQHVLTGRKISAFASLVEHGGDDDPNNPKVVVDRHALSVASGDRAGVLDYAFSQLGTKAKYDEVAKVYRDAAAQITAKTGRLIQPHQLQAVTWLVQQRQNQTNDLKRSGGRVARSARQASTLWKDWSSFASVNFPELLDHEAQTGYVTEAPPEIEQQIRLANEHSVVDLSEYMDLAYSELQSAPVDTVVLQPPPTEDETVQHVVEILLASYGLYETARLINKILPGLPIKLMQALITMTGGTGGHRAHARLNGMDPSTDGGRAATAAARSEVFYRAAYLLRATERVAHDVNTGKPVPEALADEKIVFKSHEAARRNRLNAATNVGEAANMFGPLLGWYLDPSLNNERECIVANGHNFFADQGTVIGLPGAVHLNCGCTAGPAHEGATSVNEAIAGSREVIFEEPRRYGLVRKAS